MTGVDEFVMFYGKAALGQFAKGSFEHGFTLSIMRAAKKPQWKPSTKQQFVMDKIAGEVVPDSLELMEAFE